MRAGFIAGVAIALARGWIHVEGFVIDRAFPIAVILAVAPFMLLGSVVGAAVWTAGARGVLFVVAAELPILAAAFAPLGLHFLSLRLTR